MTELRVGIGTPLADDLVERVRSAPDVQLEHPAQLLGDQRHVADHAGDRNDAQQAELVEALRGCEVVLGIPGDSPAGLAALLAPGGSVRWVQATAAGAGEQVRKADLDEDALSGIRITTTAGVHVGPLAEFAMFGLLAFHKDLDRLLELRAEREWPSRWPMTQLRGRRLLVIGMGSIGQAVAELAQAFGMTVTGVRRRSGEVDGIPVRAMDELGAAAAEADDVVLALPGTPETEGLLDAGVLAALPAGAVVVNVGRGSCIDEAALADALRSGHLRGAVLDVAATEPRPPDDPLWTLPTLLQSPHTAALSTKEDERIVELFLDNLRRYRAGEPLVNEVDTDLFY